MLPKSFCHSRLIRRCFSEIIHTKNEASQKPKLSIYDYTKDEIQEQFSSGNLPKFRTDQVWSWLYAKGSTSFDEMMNMSKSLREHLSQRYHINRAEVIKDDISNDGTRKFLLGYGCEKIETVFIPETSRGTVCVSSQVGCTFACTFCYTGKQKLLRNLTTGEIVSQVMTVKQKLYDFPKNSNRVVSNIVFMGQGEPFYNYKNVSKAIKILTDPNGLTISKSKITVSTSGVVPMIHKLGTDFPGISLAISLHAVTNELRSQIVPANIQWPIEELIEACKNFPGIGPFNRVTFEYVLLKDVNDGNEMAITLANLIKGFPSLVNLIPFNPWPGAPYECPSNNKVHNFAKILRDEGVTCTIRWPRGRDILAACGQLRTENINKELFKKEIEATN